MIVSWKFLKVCRLQVLSFRPPRESVEFTPAVFRCRGKGTWEGERGQRDLSQERIARATKSFVVNDSRRRVEMWAAGGTPTSTAGHLSCGQVREAPRLSYSVSP
ncbi:hypothetical protein E2C01_065904 [Portunus trituberculatus]|uniref:Uncharacterized protein n=1 Tax=Portunus trituberculatus TaxID=210409 RepID=A0A5B7HGT8_PORTR|nr:hypothetical protein [Portunus trituberculatus]